MNILAYRKQLIIGGSLILLGVLGWLIYFYFFTFSVLSVSPDAGRFSTRTPIIELQTNQTLSKDQKITIDDGSTGIVASVVPFKKNLIINLYQNIEADKTYTITLKNITAGEKYLMDYTYTFTAKADSSLLSEKESQILLDRQDEKPAIVSDPVYAATPFSTNSYVVKSILGATADGKGSVTLSATIFLTRDDMAFGKDASVAKYTLEIKDRLTSITGYTAEKYPIVYKIQEP